VFGLGETTFFKKNSIWCRRDDTRFLKCAFGVDETLVGERSLLKMYVLRRRDVRWRAQFRGKSDFLTHRPRRKKWRPEKHAFGVGETFVFLRNIFFSFGLSVTLGHRQAAQLDSARLGSAPLPKGPTGLKN
jgi:hypothetical protein